MNDEQAVRDLIAEWMRASNAGDLQGVLKLMADDVVFSVPGKEPFGRQEFIAGYGWTKKFRLDASHEVVEVNALGEWALIRCRLRVAMIPLAGGETIRHAGYTLSILRKRPDGRWELWRDANMLTPES